MRSLVVTRWAPWPPTSGARHRSANLITALAGMGEVDVFLLADPRHSSDLVPPDGLAVGRMGFAHRDPTRRHGVDRLIQFLPGSDPIDVRRAEVAEQRRQFSAWCEGHYDLAWFVRIESWLALGDLVDAPVIIDYDDLRDHLVRSRLRSAWPDPLGSSVPLAKKARRSVGRASVSADARAWRRLQRRVAGKVEAVVVCSEVDRVRLDLPNAAIVPNGVDLPVAPVGQIAVQATPTICMQGSLGYDPNTDAATVLVRDVAPRVRQSVPDLVVRLVGRNDERVARMADAPRVIVTGPVPDMEVELAKVDVVAVPLRQGAGTRIKVLEALAHRLPVVATSVAVEGLAVEHGREVLIADEPVAFADACVRLLRDIELRRQLVDAGEALVRDRYQWDLAREAVVRLATDVVARADRVGG